MTYGQRRTMNSSPYKKKLHFLYHIEDVGFKMLTESEAEDYKSKNGDVIWNVHKAIDLEPDYLETK